MKQPLVLRLAGTNFEKGQQILRDSNIKYVEATTLFDAAKKAVNAIEGEVA